MGIRERLLQTRGPASPRRINEVLHPTEIDAERIMLMLPSEVAERVNRGSDPNRKKRFLKNLLNLLEGGTEIKDLVKMDEECVDNKGRINEDRLRQILNGEFDD